MGYSIIGIERAYWVRIHSDGVSIVVLIIWSPSVEHFDLILLVEVYHQDDTADWAIWRYLEILSYRQIKLRADIRCILR